MRIVTCHQPTYLPWGGLLHKVSVADVFVVMDTVTFSRHGWQNRNRIKGSEGPFWLTVPLAHAQSPSRRLCDIMIDAGPDAGDPQWQRRHWEGLRRSYGRAPYWRRYADFFEELYFGRKWERLLDLDLAVVERILGLLGIETEFVLASALGTEGRKSSLVLDHCRRTDATVYVSGINGHDYLNEGEFLAAGVSIFYQRYRSTPYEQRFGGFIPNLAVVDVLFNAGPESAAILLDANVERTSIVEAARTGPVVLETFSGEPPRRDGVVTRDPVR